jgi:hypothetical protein
MNIQPLDVVVLVRDVPAHHLRRGDVGAVVEIYGPDALAVECGGLGANPSARHA